MLDQPALPRTAREDAIVAAAARPAPRVLVIYDDNLHRMIVSRVAAKAGYEVSAAATYEEATRLAQETTFDCISLDLSLGDHAGVEILRHLWVIGCKAPIVIISGCDNATCSETAKVAESLKLSVWQSIAKPVNLPILRQSLERLRGSREEPEAQQAQISPA